MTSTLLALHLPRRRTTKVLSVSRLSAHLPVQLLEELGTPKPRVTTRVHCIHRSSLAKKGTTTHLDGREEHEYIEESGTMNAMFVFNGTLVSPKTSETILDGVTRDSLQLARTWVFRGGTPHHGGRIATWVVEWERHGSIRRGNSRHDQAH